MSFKRDIDNFNYLLFIEMKVDEAADIIYGAVDTNANIIFGAMINEFQDDDEVSVTVIATGFPDSDTSDPFQIDRMPRSNIRKGQKQRRRFIPSLLHTNFPNLSV